MAQNEGANNSSGYNLLAPATLDPEFRQPSNSQASTAYEPSYVETESFRSDAVDDAAPIRTSVSSWALEVLAILISTGAIIATIALLYRENGRALTSWTLAVTLNTVVAALGTLARTTLAFALSACIGQQKWNWLRRKPDGLVAWERFDEASRGPWGGTRLFVWLRARHWAALGALVTVGAIAFDPFLQAVISTYGQLDIIKSGVDATIGQSLRINSGTIMIPQGQGARAEYTSTGHFAYPVTIGSKPDFGFISSVYNGFQNTSTFRNDAIGTACSTGNCTWPVFTSAAICSSCKDVSSHMERFERHGNKGTNIPLAGTRGYNASFVVYNLPYANIRNYVGMVQDDNKGERTDAAPVRTYMTANTTIEVNRTISFKNLDTLLMAFIVMRASDDWLGSQIPWEASTPTATECALYLCANAYEAKSENSLVKERLVGSWAYRAPGSYQVNWDSDEWNLSPGAEGYVASLGTKLYDAKIGRTDLQLLIPEFSSTALPAHLPRAFNVSHAFIFSAIDFLIDFSQSNEQPIGLPAGSRNGTPVDETWDMLGVPWTNDQMPPVVDALWNSTNLTATFENVARSLTNQIRNASPDRHQGELQQWVMHVRVDWAYLAYPIAMLVAGIVYVVLTIIESTRLRMPVWKESALPTLLHGFDDESQRLLRKDGKAAQRKTIVRFERDGEGRLRLVAV